MSNPPLCRLHRDRAFQRSPLLICLAGLATVALALPIHLDRAHPTAPAENIPALPHEYDPTSPPTEWTSNFEDALETLEYQPSETQAGLQAPNRAHRLRTYFDPTGVRVGDRMKNGPPALLELSVQSFGRATSRVQMSPGIVSHNHNRVEIARPELGLTEWYVNSPAGLEQGFTLDTKPAGTGPLDVHLSVGQARVTQKGDELRFETEAGRRLRFSKLLAEDSEGTVLASHFEPTDSGFRIFVEDAGAVYPILIDPLLTKSFDSEIESNQVSAFLGRSVASAGDVNGDGYGDVIVGATHYDSGSLTNPGAAFLFHGGPNGLGDGNPINADTVFQSDQSHSRFGHSVASAGDVNGDGYDDVVVGAYRYETAGGPVDEGAAWVFLGGPNGIADGSPQNAHAELRGNQASARFGYSVSSAGDVNGDGFGDLLIGAHQYERGQIEEGGAFVFLGSPTGISDSTAASAHATFESDQSGSSFGIAVASAGDLNADGFGDIVIGAPEFDESQFGGPPVTDAGLAVVYLGSASGLQSGGPEQADFFLTNFDEGAHFGQSVSGAGDLNGDGYGDLVVGSPNEVTSVVEGIVGGAAYVYSGGPGGISAAPDTRIASFYEDSYFGFSVASAGDLDGDGYGDLVVGAFQQSGDYGAVYFFSGRASGIPSGSPTSADVVIVADEPGERFGIAVASAGDVNGDGFSDLIVGSDTADGPQTDEGQAYVYHGGGLGITGASPMDAHSQLESNQVRALFGASVASAGDINGDGYDDVIVGAPYFDSGQQDEGAAFLFIGSATGLADANPSLAHAQLESDQADALFGISVASAGDVNGDGFGDVIVGAERFTAGQPREGAAFLFTGSPAGISDADVNSAHARLESNQTNAWMGGSVASAGDVNGDGFGDVIVGASRFDSGTRSEGNAFIFLGSPAGIANGDPNSAHARIESNQEDAHLGSAVASAGDINGDGFGDVIVGSNLFDSGSSENAGAAFIFLGSATGIPDADPDSAHARIESNQTSAFLGKNVASAGDVNGDGFGDVIIGVAAFDLGQSSEGIALVFLGSALGIPSGDPSSADTLLQSDQAGALFGSSVAGAGDVNGDGYADVIIGAVAFDSSPSTIREGAAFIFLGSAGGIASGGPNSAHAQIEANQGSAWLGNSVASAGDVNGDGLGDVIIGASNFEAGTLREGAAFVFLGNDGGRSTKPRQFRGDGSGIPVQPWGGSNENDSFRVELEVTSPLGRELAKLDIEACPSGTPFGHTRCRHQTSSNWTDLGLSGALISQSVTGLNEGTLYRWRARALYAPIGIGEPGVSAPPTPRVGPWRRIGGGASAGEIRVPEPNLLAGLVAGGAYFGVLATRRRRRPESSLSERG